MVEPGLRDGYFPHEWELEGFSATEGREWWRQALSAHEAAKWRREGFHAEDAATWYLDNFEPAEAAKWRDLGFDRCEARQWHRKKCGPEDAAARRDSPSDGAGQVDDMTIGEIVRSYLKDHGFEGLYNDDRECGCALDDLVPCGEDFSRCKPGFKSVCDCGNDYFHAVPTKYWLCEDCSAEKESKA